METRQENALALIRDEDTGSWLRYTQAAEVISTYQVDEVATLVQYIEQQVERGLTAIGYIAYEAAPAFDSSLRTHTSLNTPPVPLLCFALFRAAEKTTLPEVGTTPWLSFNASISKQDYLERVRKIKEHLGAGDSYQVNFTYQLCREIDSDSVNSVDLFAALYQQQPSPHSLFFQCADITLCSVSPELFFRLDDEHIAMEPMKGTRVRSKDAIEDQKLRAELLSSEKEKAENLMIVDMVRNDLAKIASPGSVSVDSLFEIMALPTLWQQVSRVSANTHASVYDILGALFPCASITGAPKKQSMEIIKALEKSPRGVYTGAIGVIRPHRQVKFSVGIRTLITDTQAQRMSYGVGSGIVWDSLGDSEWRETQDKAKVLQQQPAFQLLETMRYDPQSGIYLLDFHLDRIQASAKHLGYQCNESKLRTQLNEIIAEHPLRIRLLLDSTGNFVIETTELMQTSKTVVVSLANNPVYSHDLFLHHKTTQREIYENAKAGHTDVDDVVLWNERGELTETSIYNLFLEIDGEFVTPCLSSGLLAGTLRRELLRLGKVKEAVLKKTALKEATAIFVGNSVRGLIPASLKAD